MQKNQHWLVTLDGSDTSLFGKQFSVQPKKNTCMIVHWISDCLSSPSDVICLCPCLGCETHIPFPSANKYTTTTTEVISPYSWADLSITMIPYYRRLDILPDFSSSSSVVECDLTVASPLDDLSTLPSPLIPDAGYLNSVATYAHGTIQNWPSSTRAEAAAIYATLSVSPDDSTITIYTDSQAAIDGLNLCSSSSYTNSRLYYKTTIFELWASIESSI
ncbi:hypothetical protein RclHR1_02360028 [Rhizophagus clarus]|uniref:Uncharacterized protein n=1 Tax=Rhizophagus clarus TaxID=94130 RepID=A0A2Z6QWS8_9GLOM|nr:hypothetical protein RclHR1_02360028 [Rhizophagus clarus]